MPRPLRTLRRRLQALALVGALAVAGTGVTGLRRPAQRRRDRVRTRTCTRRPLLTVARLETARRAPARRCSPLREAQPRTTDVRADARPGGPGLGRLVAGRARRTCGARPAPPCRARGADALALTSAGGCGPRTGSRALAVARPGSSRCRSRAGRARRADRGRPPRRRRTRRSRRAPVAERRLAVVALAHRAACSASLAGLVAARRGAQPARGRRRRRRRERRRPRPPAPGCRRRRGRPGRALAGRDGRHAAGAARRAAPRGRAAGVRQPARRAPSSTPTPLPAVLEVAGARWTSSAPGRPMELLLADSSRAHMQTAAVLALLGRPRLPGHDAARLPGRTGRRRRRRRAGVRARRVPAPARTHRHRRRGLRPHHLHGPGRWACCTPRTSRRAPPTRRSSSRACVRSPALTGSRLGTVRALASAELQASTDLLTGLCNRRTAEDRLRQLQDGGEAYGLVLLDLDHFKAINDAYGHEAGDRALRVFATVLAGRPARAGHRGPLGRRGVPARAAGRDGRGRPPGGRAGARAAGPGAAPALRPARSRSAPACPTRCPLRCSRSRSRSPTRRCWPRSGTAATGSWRPAACPSCRRRGRRLRSSTGRGRSAAARRSSPSNQPRSSPMTSLG